MSAFTEVAFLKKLAELNSSQQSIQTLSLWLIHHRKHHASIVKTWLKELQNGKWEIDYIIKRENKVLNIHILICFVVV